MIKHNQNGAVNALAVSLVMAVLLLIGAIAFGGWAFTSRQDYKDNTDAKIAAAVSVAKQKEDSLKAREFAEVAKNPLAIYHGPEAYGSVTVSYPKTWSGYVSTSGNGSSLVDGYFAPGVVPGTTDPLAVFALRMQVLSQTYAQTLQSFTSQQTAGKLTVAAYALPKLPKITGVQVTGQINDKTSVTMVVLPLRSQTLQIWTEGNQYLNDFNTYILPNFTFSP